MNTTQLSRRRARPRRRPWQPEVPAAFAVPDVPEFAHAAPGPAGVPAEATDQTTEDTDDTVAGRSRDGSVDVEVDLRGHLRRLRIDPRTLRGPHPQRVGDAVVEAMADARRQAIRLTRERRGR